MANRLLTKKVHDRGLPQQNRPFDAPTPVSTMDSLGPIRHHTTPTDYRLVTEQSRLRICKWLLLVLVVVIVGLFVIIETGSVTVGGALQIWGAISVPVIGLLGVIIGFYGRDRHADRRTDTRDTNA
jgi:hypothetical protein